MFWYIVLFYRFACLLRIDKKQAANYFTTTQQQNFRILWTTKKKREEESMIDESERTLEPGTGT